MINILQGTSTIAPVAKGTSESRPGSGDLMGVRLTRDIMTISIARVDAALTAFSSPHVPSSLKATLTLKGVIT